MVLRYITNQFQAHDLQSEIFCSLVGAKNPKSILMKSFLSREIFPEKVANVNILIENISRD